MFRDLEQRIDLLLADPTYEEAALSNGYREHLDRAERNRTLLRSFLAERGWGRRSHGPRDLPDRWHGVHRTHVAKLLLDEPDMELVVLVLAPDPPEAEHLLARAWWDLPDLGAAIGKNVHAVAGDVRSPRLGLPDDIYRDLVRRVDVIIHAAADLRLDASIEDLRRTNVEGVRHVLEFAREIDAVHGLQRLVHVSTAYVAGGGSGTIDEGPPSDRFGFLNPYERSKYEGEMLVRAAMDGRLPIAIARPSMVVGDSRTGAINDLQHVLCAAAGVPDRTASDLADASRPSRERRAGRSRGPGDRPHGLRPGGDRIDVPFDRADRDPPDGRQLVNVVRTWARNELGVRLPRPIFVPIALPSALGRERGQARGGRPGPLMPLLPYFQEERAFLRENTDRLLGPYDLAWRNFLPRLLTYAARTGFFIAPSAPCTSRSCTA